MILPLIVVGGALGFAATGATVAILVLKLGTTPGATPDPMAREQVTSVKVPLGIAIEAQK